MHSTNTNLHVTSISITALIVEECGEEKHRLNSKGSLHIDLIRVIIPPHFLPQRLKIQKGARNAKLQPSPYHL